MPPWTSPIGCVGVALLAPGSARGVSLARTRRARGLTCLATHSFPFCFVDAVVYFGLAVMMAIMFPWRLYQVYHSEANAVAVMPGLKVIRARRRAGADELNFLTKSYASGSARHWRSYPSAHFWVSTLRGHCSRTRYCASWYWRRAGSAWPWSWWRRITRT